MKPTDLFDINTSQFSSSLPNTKFTNRPELSQAAKDQLASHLKDIKEESVEGGRSDLFASPAKTNTKLDMSLGKNSGFNEEVDGLINWANNLPDDV